MSSLTHALNQIRSWLEKNYLPGAEHIPPGLSLSQTEEILQTLSFSLPQEVYELYQWSRGNSEEALTNSAFIFDPDEGMALCSLERGREILPIFEIDYEDVAVKYAGQPLFPIFEFEGAYLCVVGDVERKESSPIIYVSDILEIDIRYVSLTSMMLTIAECFETEAVYIDVEIPLADGRPHLRYDIEKFSPIYLKHNSRLIDLALTRLKQELSIAQFPEQAVNNFIGNIRWFDSYLRSSSNQFDSAVEPLIAALQDEDEYIKSLALLALEELNYSGNFTS